MHSAWTKVLLGVFLLFLGGSAFLPWYEYSYTTGREVSPEFERNNTAERRQAHVYPGRVESEYNITNASQVDDAARQLQILLLVPAALAAGALLVEFVGGSTSWGRYAGLSLLVLAFLTLVVVLLWTWWFVPATFKADGVTTTFTARKWNDGFIRTTLDWGWVLAALALPLNLAALAFRYSAGAFDLGIMETYHRRERPKEAPAPQRPPPKP